MTHFPIHDSAVQAASKGRNVKTPRATGRRTTASPIASTSHDVATVSSQSQPPEETHSAPSTTSPTQAEAHIDQTSEPELRSDQTSSTSLLSTVEVRKVEMPHRCMGSLLTSVFLLFLTDTQS